jgi:hypothetical protein
MTRRIIYEAESEDKCRGLQFRARAADKFYVRETALLCILGRPLRAVLLSDGPPVRLHRKQTLFTFKQLQAFDRFPL